MHRYQKKAYPIRLYVFCIFGLFGLLTALIAAAGYWSIRTVINQQIKQWGENLNNITVTRIEANLEKINQKIDALASALEVQKQLLENGSEIGPQAQKLCASYLMNNRFLKGIIFTQPDGESAGIGSFEPYIAAVSQQAVYSALNGVVQNDDSRAYIVSRYVYSNPYYKQIGSIHFIIDPVLFQEVFDQNCPYISYELVAADGQLVSRLGKEFPCPVEELDQSLSLLNTLSQDFSYAGTAYTIMRRHFSSAPLVLYGVQDISAWRNSFTGFLPWLLLAAFLGLFAAQAALLILFQKRFTRSSAEITRKIMCIQTGTPYESARPLFGLEFQTIYAELDTMSATIAQLNEQNLKYEKRMLEKEIDNRQIQLSALKNQINPHFIYNTLSCIKGMAICNDEKEIAEMCSSMAKVLRYSVDAANTATVAEEIRVCQAYLHIQSMRFVNHFSYRVNIDPSILDCRIIRFLLQPIVENAIVHGIEPQQVQGKISIEGHRQKNMIVFDISDTGKGIPPQILQQIQNKLENCNPQVRKTPAGGWGIGLANIHNRIKLFYGNEYGIEINSIVNLGTYITVRLPLTEEDSTERNEPDAQRNFGG